MVQRGGEEESGQPCEQAICGETGKGRGFSVAAAREAGAPVSGVADRPARATAPSATNTR
jgi:hypothetical protein